MLSDGERAALSQQVDLEVVGARYLDVVAVPMDLGTIRQRLAPGEKEGWDKVPYKTAAAVLADIELVFQNCRAFHHPSDDVMCA